MVAMNPNSKSRELSDDCRQRKSHSELLSQILLIGEMAYFLYENTHDLQATEELRPVTEELIEKLQHGLQAHDRPFKVGALLRSSIALAEVVQQECADCLEKFQWIDLVLSTLLKSTILAHIEQRKVLSDPSHELEDLLSNLERVWVVLRKRACEEKAPQNLFESMSFTSSSHKAPVIVAPARVKRCSRVSYLLLKCVEVLTLCSRYPSHEIVHVDLCIDIAQQGGLDEPKSIEEPVERVGTRILKNLDQHDLDSRIYPKYDLSLRVPIFQAYLEASLRISSRAHLLVLPVRATFGSKLSKQLERKVRQLIEDFVEHSCQFRQYV